VLLSNRKLRVALAKQLRLGRKILVRSFIGMSFFAIICCGKKVEESNKSSSSQRETTPISTDLEQVLNNQQLTCEPGAVCPNYIALVNVIDRGKLRSCTGFLVGRDIIATSASCLPSLLRLADQDCSEDVHIYFGSIINSDRTLRFGCQKVIGASDLKSSNPVRWRDDIAFLKMSNTLSYRRTLEFSRKGFKDLETYSSWYVTRMDERTSFIKKATCRNIQSSYVNPFANNVSSPNILVSDCNLSDNASGAPLLDGRGEVRGMISTKTNSSISDYLIKAGLTSAPLKTMYHGTSFACAPTIYDTHVLNEVECLKDMGQVALDEEISKLLNPQQVFEDARQKLETELNNQVSYVSFQASLEGDNGERRLSFSPRCFKPLSDWLNTVENSGAFVMDFSFPAVEVKKSLDAYGKLFAHVIEHQTQKYNIQFSVKNLKRYANSRVFFWNDDFNFSYPRITANCQ